MSEPGDPGYQDMLEHQTGTEVPAEDQELDPFEQEILDLGAPPGPGATANECDAYNMAVYEIERRRMAEAKERAENPDEVDDVERVTEPTRIDPHTNELVTGDLT